MSLGLLSLPVEVLCAILNLLDFDDVVSISGVCGDLRKLTLAECQLWKDLPVAEVPQLDAITPFVSRSGQLGAHLSVVDIKPFELADLSVALGILLKKLRRLRLEFSRTDMEDCDELMDTWYVLSQEAPLLETLEFASTSRGEFMQDIPSFAFTGDLFPSLRSLEITAFSLDAVCTAFRNVTHVTTTVAALAPRSQPALPTGADKPDWANFRVHDHFPAIHSLRLFGIELEDDDDFADILTSVPYIDTSLDELLLVWRPQRRVNPASPIQDDSAVRWLQESMRYVRAVTIVNFDWSHIRDVVFASLAGGGRLSLCIGHGPESGFLRMTVSSEDLDIQRIAIFPQEDLVSHLDKVVALPGVSVAEVVVPAELRLRLSLGFFAARTYCGSCNLKTVYP